MSLRSAGCFHSPQSMIDHRRALGNGGGMCAVGWSTLKIHMVARWIGRNHRRSWVEGRSLHRWAWGMLEREWTTWRLSGLIRMWWRWKLRWWILLLLLLLLLLMLLLRFARILGDKGSLGVLDGLGHRSGAGRLQAVECVDASPVEMADSSVLLL
jgi:hypothetical protein